MPIKFRCNFCRQFLGISRAQAGGVVDCPTCGRSIRVPLLDGTVQPLPTPELNLQDAHLARALDELAQLGDLLDQPLPVAKSAAMGFERESNENGDDGDEANQIPQPIPEPIPIEMPIAPTPIKLDRPIQVLEPPPNASSVVSGQSAASGQGASNVLSTRENERSLMAELLSLAEPPVDQRLPSAQQSHVDELPRSENHSAFLASGSRPMQRPAVSFRSAFAVLGLFLSGMFVERFVRVLESLSPAASPAMTAPVAAPVVPSELSGRITYKSAEGESQPDRGARLIVFPDERPGEVKLPVVGFRPADGEADARVAAATINALGGTLATVDEAGRFQLNLPAGSYRVLVLSRFQSRDEAQAADPALLKQLAAYFENPIELLGRAEHHFAPLRIKGTGEIWDHSF